MDIYNVIKNFDIDLSKYCSIKVKDRVWRIHSDVGDYCLKKSKLTCDRLEFIHNAMSGLSQNGYQRFPELVLSRANKTYCMLDGECYTLTTWIDGQKCDAVNPTHLGYMARSLGDFHQCAEGLQSFQGAEGRINYTIHLTRYQDRLNDLYTYSNSNYFADNMIIAMAERSVDLLDKSSYYDVAMNYYHKGGFIHNDIAARNFIIKNNEAYLIDFDYLSMDLPHIDLMRLINRSMKHSIDYRDSLMAIISGYMKSYAMDYDDFAIIYAMLLFPQKVWRVLSRNDMGEKGCEYLDYAIDSIHKKYIWLDILADIIGLEDRYDG